MRILHLIHNYPPEFLGGTERYLQALVGVQVSRGDEVVVLAGSEDKRPKAELVEESSSGPKVYRFYRAQGDDYTVNFEPAGAKEFLAEVVATEKPDAVHVQHWFNLGNGIISFLKSLGCRVVLTIHDLYSGCPRLFMIRPDGFFCGQQLPIPVSRCVDCVAADFEPPDLEDQIRKRRSVMTREIRSASRVIVPSQAHRRMIRRARIAPDEAMTVLDHGLITEVGECQRDNNRPAGAPLRIGTWGHLSKVKGIPQLLDAFEILHRKHEGKVEFHLFGEATADYREELEERMAQFPITHHGSFGAEDMSRIGETLDVAVFPSHAYESYSFVLDEAWALGIPTLVSDRGALADRGRGICETVDVLDPESMAESLESYVLDSGKLLEAKARIPRQPFTIEDHAKVLDGYYREAQEENTSKVDL